MTSIFDLLGPPPEPPKPWARWAVHTWTDFTSSLWESDITQGSPDPAKQYIASVTMLSALLFALLDISQNQIDAESVKLVSDFVQQLESIQRLEREYNDVLSEEDTPFPKAFESLAFFLDINLGIKAIPYARR